MSKIFDMFVGSFVRLTLKKDNKDSIMHNNTIKSVASSYVIQGYLVDEDDEYFFLSYDDVISNPNACINVAVDRPEVLMMELADPEEDMAQMLNESVDASDTGVN